MAAQVRRRREDHPREGELWTEMFRLYELGYDLIPLGAGEDGKAPMVRFSGRKRLPLERVTAMMLKTGSLMYGIRLRGLVVIDADTDTPETGSYIRRRFGDSTVQVRTARGRHHWLRIDKTPVPAGVKEDGIWIDLKSGENAYVVGPLSIRADGTIYDYDVGELPRRTQLPAFIDRRPRARREGSGQVGERHLLLVTCEHACNCVPLGGVFRIEC